MKVLKFSSIALTALLMFGIYACQKDLKSPEVTSEGKATLTSSLAAPIVTCVENGSTQHSIKISVMAGATGAPAGFSVQWMLKSEFEKKGWPVSSEVTSESSFCKASFSGVPGCSQYNLAANTSATVEIGNLSDEECGVSGGCGELECGQEYVFRAFAHNVPGGLNKSPFSATTTCGTDPCGNGECLNETAWGGNTRTNVGAPGAWFYMYDIATGGAQTLYAGQYAPAGTVEYVNGQIVITLADGWQLQNVDEPVKIEGYQTAPTTRPAAGLFTYKGSSLTVDVASYPYYAIHVDVAHCN